MVGQGCGELLRCVGLKWCPRPTGGLGGDPGGEGPGQVMPVGAPKALEMSLGCLNPMFCFITMSGIYS